MTVSLVEKRSDDAAVTGTTELEDAASVFLRVRPLLIDIAYRVLGNASETEDVVQEAWLRWQRTDRSIVLNPQAFLATTTTRLALNVVQSAHNRRETHADAWLAEQADQGIGPALCAERAAAVEQAVLLLLRTLSATERAAFVLREAFGYPYEQIADALPLSAVHARQLVHRAQAHIAAQRGRPVNPVAHRRLVLAFRTAAATGDLSCLEKLLAADVARRTEEPA